MVVSLSKDIWATTDELRSCVTMLQCKYLYAAIIQVFNFGENYHAKNSIWILGNQDKAVAHRYFNIKFSFILLTAQLSYRKPCKHNFNVELSEKKERR